MFATRAWALTIAGIGVGLCAHAAGCREAPAVRNELAADEIRATTPAAASLTSAPATPAIPPEPAPAPAATDTATAAPSAVHAESPDDLGAATRPCPEPAIPEGAARSPRVLVAFAGDGFYPHKATPAQRALLFQHVAARVAKLERARLLPQRELDSAIAQAGDARDRCSGSPQWARALTARYPNLVTAELETMCVSEAECSFAITLELYAHTGRARWRGYSAGYRRDQDETLAMTNAANHLAPMSVHPPQQ